MSSETVGQITSRGTKIGEMMCRCTSTCKTLNEQSLKMDPNKRKHFTGGFGNHEFSPLILDDLFVANHLRFQPVSNK